MLTKKLTIIEWKVIPQRTHTLTLVSTLLIAYDHRAVDFAIWSEKAKGFHTRNEFIEKCRVQFWAKKPDFPADELCDHDDDHNLLEIK